MYHKLTVALVHTTPVVYRTSKVNLSTSLDLHIKSCEIMGQIVYAFSDSGCVGPYLLCFSYALAAIRSEARSNAYCVEDRRRQLG